MPILAVIQRWRRFDLVRLLPPAYVAAVQQVTRTVQLLPLSKTLECPEGTELQDLLFPHGVEFPCGGRGLCKGCRIKVLSGELPVTAYDRTKLSPRELSDGWRLACNATVQGDLKIELAQWEAAILADESHFEFHPRPGLGIAVDLGTTTIVAQLLDLNSGDVLGVRMALNHQAKHGADVMSRIEFAMEAKGQSLLQKLIREQLGGMVLDLLEASGRAGEQTDVVIVGNTVMHHLFSGVDVEPLSHFPFEPSDSSLRVFQPADLGWHGMNGSIRFLPCLGGFVGSDILAGLLATGVSDSENLVALLDLGTNGEIVVGNRRGMVCASTAAGPAFEGARISMGMRAATGAVAEVRVLPGGALRCHVLGGVEARGICGSGLVDAVAAGLELSVITGSGRMAAEKWLLQNEVALNRWDIRELQLAKGAIAAGLGVLLHQIGAQRADLKSVYLAGAFGNYINLVSARKIGLLKFPAEKIVPSGNAALLGAKLALFNLPAEPGDFRELLPRVRHVSLHEDALFHELYVREMAFEPGSLA